VVPIQPDIGQLDLSHHMHEEDQMKKQWTVASIAVVAALVLAACAPATPAPTAAPAPTTAPVPTAVEPTKEPSGCDAVPKGLKEITVSALQDKPSLKFTQAPMMDGVDHVIAFVFPDGLIALKAAALKEIPKPNSSGVAAGLTTVGRVEAGNPLTGYEVAIKLQTDAPDPEETPQKVGGMLIPYGGGNGLPLTFEGSPVTWNPKKKVDKPSAISVSIGSTTVCYVVGTGDGTGFWRYCSTAEENGKLLSVLDTYGSQYEQLKADIRETAKQSGVSVWEDLTISEMEDPGNINACVNGASCGADIVGAPVAGFMDTYAKLAANSGCFSIDAGAVHVLQPIGESTQPGQYKLTFWFESGGALAGATISGQPDKGAAVKDQPIPAFEPMFVGKHDPISQISAWRVGWCSFWQETCGG
jgi:hypothetical protein